MASQFQPITHKDAQPEADIQSCDQFKIAWAANPRYHIYRHADGKVGVACSIPVNPGRSKIGQRSVLSSRCAAECGWNYRAGTAAARNAMTSVPTDLIMVGLIAP